MGLQISLCPSEIAGNGVSFEAKYEMDEGNVLGTGKFSTVYMCFRRGQPNRRYALKSISTYTGDDAAVARIFEEIAIMKTIDYHSSIIRLVDLDHSIPNNIRLVLELCEGGELYDRIQQKRYYSEADTKLLVKNLLEAVQFIHSKGIMHRDLKPENILLVSKVSNTDIKVSDFGLAKLSKDWPRKLPRSTSICGSDFYLAPEVIKQEEYGREIDVWATGVITFVVLSGSLPFFNSVLHKLYRQIVERDLSFSESRWKHVSAGAQDFIMRLLQVRAGDRLTADQALMHPWLRSVSVGSFASEASSTRASGVSGSVSANYYSSAVPVK